MTQAVSNEPSVFDRKVVSSPLYVLRGAAFLLKHPVLWKFAAAPLLIGAVLLGICCYLAFSYLTALIGRFMGDQTHWVVIYYILAVILGLFLLIVSCFVFTLVATTIAAPFNDLISEKTEQLITGKVTETPFSLLRLIRDSARGIGHSVVVLGIYLGLLLLALALWLIPVVGGAVHMTATVLLSAFFLAYEYLGCPMDRRRFSFKEKMRFMRSRLKPCIGFGLGNVVVASVPVLNFLLIPAAVVGGTLLFMDFESALGRSGAKVEGCEPATAVDSM